MFFTHNTQYSLLLLIHVQIQCDLAITRNICVNVYSLNCLNLFLKYKIVRRAQCVCVCFGSMCLTFLLLRNDFKSLTCCLILGLGSMLDCIQVSVFLLFEKLFLPISTASRQLSIDCYLSRLFNCFLSHSRQLLDSYFNPSRNFLDAQQLLNSYLDPLKSYCGHLSTPPRLIEIPLHAFHFSFVLLFFFPFVSIASCFSFSCRSIVPCSPYSLYVSFLFVSCQVFWSFMPFHNRVKKGGKFQN